VGSAWQEFVVTNAGWLLVGSLGGLVIGLLLTPILITRIPPDYFSYRRRHRMDHRYPALQLIMLVMKNTIGAVFVLVGLLLLFLPGQGLLTLLLGLMLMDYPGKFALERWLIRRPRVLPALNWLREKWDHPPLQAP